MPQAAHAAEAFLCGPDTVVYVEPEELEARKRSDPCIAAYFGLKVEAGTQSASMAKAAPAPAPVLSRAPEHHATAEAALGLRPLVVSDRVSTSARGFERQAMLQAKPVSAAPGTDYRNVRVLNAQSPDEGWYRHAR